ncbi:glycosyltransferase [Agromyces sp. SYSU K20354]|uniref:glycosyltransferase n=1 Tax=Agromyces cavernae TaxID=2898659 RepID=UPI001E3C207D|nr:glycosyltransferase [Agromyces cavernae]MCD2444063.1 glycosyltransferase [Agromyces cavernae]
MSRLLLFTNDYPYRTGDAVFVEKEIEALAARFDDVVVFCHARRTDVDMVELPPSVSFGGNLFEPAPEDSPRAVLEPRVLASLATAAWRELVAGRLFGHLRLFLMGARVGITQAHRRAVRDAIAGDPDTVAYAFWGMGGGLGLAWLHGVAARAVRLHRYDLYEDRAPGGYLPFRRQLFARADLVLAISDDAKQYLAETYRSRALDRKTVVSRLGVFGPEAVERRPRGDERLVVSCSAVSEVKRVGLLLDAIRAMPGVGPEAPVRWVHFGDGELMPALRDAAAELPAGLTVELRGQTPNEELLEFYAANRVDAFVNVSSSEGVPVSIMEAIAHAIPVVATAVGGTPEIVSPTLGTGEVVEADASPEAVARVIRAVLDAPDGTYSPRSLWQREYDARVTGPRAADLVRSLLPR